MAAKIVWDVPHHRLRRVETSEPAPPYDPDALRILFRRLMVGIEAAMIGHNRLRYALHSTPGRRRRCRRRP